MGTRHRSVQREGHGQRCGEEAHGEKTSTTRRKALGRCSRRKKGGGVLLLPLRRWSREGAEVVPRRCRSDHRRGGWRRRAVGRGCRRYAHQRQHHMGIRGDVDVLLLVLNMYWCFCLTCFFCGHKFVPCIFFWAI
uniref:cDNA clone:001-114-F04, full insert sequence n=2 Tax=Oryza sativa subsp. japonica TaxID=39947 RepID=B7E8H5_ORYSJ|nr:unnamed protein product [Oryza sativa Japonica Group]